VVHVFFCHGNSVKKYWKDRWAIRSLFVLQKIDTYIFESWQTFFILYLSTFVDVKT
jgi:hypothetical protein